MTPATATKKRTSRKKKTLAPVLVTMVLDRSGSMGSCRDETIEAFNSYLEGLRADEGETFVTLRQFDGEHQLDYRAVPVNDVQILTHDTYEPRGSTALNDAIALGIADADTAEVPDGVRHLLVVITDGHENASQEHDLASINKLVKQREKKGWTVVFLQGNLDVAQAKHIAHGYGIAGGNVAVYDSHQLGSVSATMSAVSLSTSTLRGPTGPTGPQGAVGSTGSFFADAGQEQDHSKAGKKK